MPVGIFAGIAVSDFRQSLDWYKRFLGAEPTFYPNDIDAVWELAEDRYVYIIRDLDRVLDDDLDADVARTKRHSS